MNSLTQDNTSLLIGSRQDIEALEKKHDSRILLVSDSHGAAFTFSTILKEFGKSSDALIFCGDGISDLTRCMEEAVHDRTFAECIPPVIAFVRGNNDTDMYPYANPSFKAGNDEPYFLQMNVPLHASLCASGHRILAAHGHTFHLYSGHEALVQAALNEKADTVVFGHTHFPLWEISFPSVCVINPGSCSRPREMMPPSFAVLSLEKGKPAEDVIFYKIDLHGINPFIP